jgi:mannose-6-phosphate isomerase-like protein (cupin superfamily)
MRLRCAKLMSAVAAAHYWSHSAGLQVLAGAGAAEARRRRDVFPASPAADGACQDARMEEGTARTRLDFDTTERFVPLRRLLGVTSFGLNEMVLAPGQRGRIHRHKRQEEVYVVLEGRLTVIVEGEPHDLQRGELMRVGPSVRRQLVNLGPSRVVLIALGGAGEHNGRDAEAFAAWDASAGASPQELPLPDDLGADELRR